MLQIIVQSDNEKSILTWVYGIYATVFFSKQQWWLGQGDEKRSAEPVVSGATAARQWQHGSAAITGVVTVIWCVCNKELPVKDDEMRYTVGSMVINLRHGRFNKSFSTNWCLSAGCSNVGKISRLSWRRLVITKRKQTMLVAIWPLCCHRYWMISMWPLLPEATESANDSG